MLKAYRGPARLLFMAATLTFMSGTASAEYQEVAKLIGDPPVDLYDLPNFGHAVVMAADGETIAVGAWQDNMLGEDSGAVYVFERGGLGVWTKTAKIAGSDTESEDHFGWSVAIDEDTLVVGATAKRGDEAAEGAAYVFDRGGDGSWTEIAKLTASDADAYDRFGWAVGVSGDTVAVGASYAESGAGESGAVYLFERDAGGPGAWGEVAIIPNPDPTYEDYFGNAVVVDGDLLVVGTHRDEDLGYRSGSVHVFERDPGSSTGWSHVTKLLASDGEPGDEFGYAVAVDGDMIVVGALFEDETGGAVYAFERGPAGWEEEAKITADVDPTAKFGRSVALEGDRLVVGAVDDDQPGMNNAGAVYVFDRLSPGTWSQVQKLAMTDPSFGDHYGVSVDIGNGRIVSGADYDDGDVAVPETTCIQCDEGGPGSTPVHEEDPPPPSDQPPSWSCDEDGSCCVAPGASSGGGGPSASLPGSGPGALLWYRAGGVGGNGFPGSGAWQATLGRYWSHSYAERIVPYPDESHVALLTRWATFREFADPDQYGVYQAKRPSDEYRKLRLVAPGQGWEFYHLDGTVMTFNASGRWTQTVDRNGNATIAAYDGLGRLSAVSFPDGRSESFTYDVQSGKLATITEVGVEVTNCGQEPANCRKWSYVWEGDDLIEIVRPDGTGWKLLYEDSRHPGYMTQMILVGTDLSERIVQAWEYDATGNVITTWKGEVSPGPDGPIPGLGAVEVWRFSFDDPTLPSVTTVTDPLGDNTLYRMRRDPGGTKPRILSVEGGCPVCGTGPNTSFEYQDFAHPLLPSALIDGYGTRTEYTYDENGQPLTKTEAANTPLARTTTWTYNQTYPAFPETIARPSTSGSGERLATLVYDPSTGDLIQREESGAESGGTFALGSIYTYNDAGKSLTLDPPGYDQDDVTTFVYPPAGSDPRNGFYPGGRVDPILGPTNPTAFEYDAFNRQIAVTDPNDVTTTTSYDDPAGFGKLDRVYQVVQEGAARVDNLVTEYSYTPFGDLFQTILPRGNVIEYGYDLAGRLISIERKLDPQTPGERTFWTLDDAGNRIREALQKWSGGAWVPAAITDYEYARRCELELVIQAPGTPEESITEYAYDCNGNIDRVWDANHTARAVPSQDYEYDELNRLITLCQPGPCGGPGAATSYGYDVQDHLTSVFDAEGNLTEYQYSDRDLMTEETSLVSGITTLAYNAHGELVSELDAREIEVLRTVDALDRVTAVVYPDSDLDTDFTYDDPGVAFSKGRLTQIARPGYVVDYTYDRFGRVLQDGALTYAYDKNSNRTKITYPVGMEAIYTYDLIADRQKTLVAKKGGFEQPLVSTAAYKPFGPLSALALGNNLVETRGFDGRYFPSSISVPGVSPPFSWTYTTDGVGNVTAITDPNPLLSRSYTYDPDHYFLTGGAGPWGTLQWTYDLIGSRLTEVRDGGQPDTYEYLASSIGNNPQLVSRTFDGGSKTEYYGYDLAGNLTSISGDTTRTFLYDDASRLAQVTPGPRTIRASLTYDGRGFLGESLFEPGTPGESTTTSATYDSAGMLVHRQRSVESGSPPPDQHTFVFYFAGRPVATLKGDDSGGGGLTNLVLTFLTTDHLGTPVLATNVGGGQVWKGGFEPFGDDFAGAQNAGVFLRFPGQWQDLTWENPSLETGLYYNVNRWYETGTGRYTSVDPLGPFGSRHPYVYTRNQPLRYTDRLGLRECGEAPIGPAGADCLEFCQAQKEYAECQLEKQLEGIHLAGAGLASLAGVTAGFETGSPLVGCLVGGGVFLIDLGIHYAWESFGGGAIELTDNKCRQNCCGGNKPDGEGAGPGGGVCPGT